MRDRSRTVIMEGLSGRMRIYVFRESTRRPTNFADGLRRAIGSAIPMWSGLLCFEGREMSESLLGSEHGLASLLSLLMLRGDACPKCGHGTRKTSKNWRRCKRETCQERIHMIPAPTTPEGQKQYLRDARKAGAVI